MRIILQKEETEFLFLRFCQIMDTDNPSQLESIEIQNRIRHMITHYQDYPEILEQMEQSSFLRHLLWFSPYKIEFTPRGEMICYIETDRFFTM